MVDESSGTEKQGDEIAKSVIKKAWERGKAFVIRYKVLDERERS